MVIDKVISVYLDIDDMEVFNRLIGRSDFETKDFWADKSLFEDFPALYEFLDECESRALEKGDTKYIAFRLDDY